MTTHSTVQRSHNPQFFLSSGMQRPCPEKVVAAIIPGNVDPEGTDGKA